MKYAVVTGASRGIGLAACQAFIREGWIVYGLFSGASSSSEAPDALAALGVRPLLCDVSEESSVIRSFSEILKEVPRIDCLVNNAGISYIGLLQSMTVADWDRIMDINLKGPFLCIRQVIPSMLREQAGSIVNISSMWGTYGASTEAAYSASKGGLNSLTRALAKELAPSGIRVNAIACGAIDTSMNAFLSPEERSDLENEIGMGRMGKPEEVADLILYLSGEHSTYLTGDVIALDGGF